jgi:hypothetical protein
MYHHHEYLLYFFSLKINLLSHLTDHTTTTYGHPLQTILTQNNPINNYLKFGKCLMGYAAYSKSSQRSMK